MNNNVELALPAGSLQAALQAFTNGSDAVYLGLKQFSARKGAQNFTLKELSQLKQFALKENKKIQVALNTVVDDVELDQLTATLSYLEYLNIDAIIVQDLGLALLIKENFPNLKLHASTQLAVHTIEGVKQLEQAGFERVVLARELTFKQIKEIREACPSIELKVFIHGALCYGFSGLCMASHYLTGRSANRGECAQICRTYFSLDQNNSNSYYFSMTDLAQREEILKLATIGIDALKIEGRMKSPSYVYHATKYYRSILEGKNDKKLQNNLSLQFERKNTSGWTFNYGKEKILENRKTQSLVAVDYTAHLGLEVGFIEKIETKNNKSLLYVNLKEEIAIRDGLMLFYRDNNNILKPITFSLLQLKNREGKPIIKSSSFAIIEAKEKIRKSYLPKLYSVSKHNLNIPLINENLELYRHLIEIKISVTQNKIKIESFNLPFRITNSYEKEYPFELQEAQREQKLVQNFENIFLNATNNYVKIEKIELENKTKLKATNIFIPLSQLKEIRRDYLVSLENYLTTNNSFTLNEPKRETKNTKLLPKRGLLHNQNKTHLPFIDPINVIKQLKDGKDKKTLLPKIETSFYLPLVPITFDEKLQFEALDEIIKIYGDNVIVGLNNVAHLRWAKKRANVKVFVDVYLYVANRYTATYFYNELPNLIGLYGWLERKELTTTNWPISPTFVEDSFKLPLFISRACFRYDSLNLPCEGCPRHGSWKVEQSNKNYTVDVIECITYVSQQIEQN